MRTKFLMEKGVNGKVLIKTDPNNPNNKQLITFDLPENEFENGKVHMGDLVTGTDRNGKAFPTGILNVLKGDVYWNVGVGESRGNMYTCIEGDVGGTLNSALWAYRGNISTVETTMDSREISITHILRPNSSITFNSSNISNVEINIPDTTKQGFLSEVAFQISSSILDPKCTLKWPQDTQKTFAILRNGRTKKVSTTTTDIPVSPGTEINLLFRDNGISIICAIVEL